MDPVITKKYFAIRAENDRGAITCLCQYLRLAVTPRVKGFVHAYVMNGDYKILVNGSEARVAQQVTVKSTVVWQGDTLPFPLHDYAGNLHWVEQQLAGYVPAPSAAEPPEEVTW